MLTLLGSCMLLKVLMEKILRKVNAGIGIVVSFAMFLIFRNINYGFLGFERWNILKISEFLYRNSVTAYLGFPAREFHSSDCFLILPWIFLFISGYFLYRIVFEGKNRSAGTCNRVFLKLWEDIQF